jgi:hypothetical protein
LCTTLLCDTGGCVDDLEVDGEVVTDEEVGVVGTGTGMKLMDPFLSTFS